MSSSLTSNVSFPGISHISEKISSYKLTSDTLFLLFVGSQKRLVCIKFDIAKQKT